MANKHLSLHPYSIHPDCWVYEHRGGIEVIHYTRDGNQKNSLIPWRKLRDALARKTKPAGGNP